MMTVAFVVIAWLAVGAVIVGLTISPDEINKDGDGCSILLFLTILWPIFGGVELGAFLRKKYQNIQNKKEKK